MLEEIKALEKTLEDLPHSEEKQKALQIVNNLTKKAQEQQRKADIEKVTRERSDQAKRIDESFEKIYGPHNLNLN